MATRGYAVSAKGKVVDQIAEIDAEIEKLTAKLVAKRERLVEKLKTEEGTFIGTMAQATVSYVEPVIFKKEIAKQFLTPAQLKKCLKPGEAYYRVKITSL